MATLVDVRGSKRKLRDGVWELRLSLGRDPVTGGYRRLSKTFHGSARQADDALRDLIDELAPRTDTIGATFSQLLDEWLGECERLELSPTTMRNYHAIISVALHQGVRWGWVRRNVAELAKAPRVSTKRVEAPSVEVVRKVIEAAEERDPRQAPLLMLAALTGMRRGELCALRWSAIDLDKGVIEVTGSVVVVPGGLAVKSTKTGRSRRVALDQVGVALLRSHRARVEDWARQCGVGLPEDAFVFSPYLDAHSPFRPDNVTSFFIRVREAVGAPEVRLHDLRHFTATQLIGAGVDVRTVAGRLGHADPSVTLRVYAHVIEERDRAAAAIMGQVLGAAPVVEVPGGPGESQGRTS